MGVAMISGLSYAWAARHAATSGAVHTSVVLHEHTHSSAVSTRPCHRYVELIGPDTWAQAASRAPTARRPSSSASARDLAVVVTTQ